MASRGWARLLAKRADFEQSLLHHTLAQLDVWLQVFPEFDKPNHFGLSDDEKRAVFVGSLAHDCGKSTAAWQSYVNRGGEPNPEEGSGKVSHIVPGLTEEVVKELWPTMGFGSADQAPLSEIDQYVRLHHNVLRTDRAIFQAVLAHAEGAISDRWNTLSRLVDCVDNLVSAQGPLAAQLAARRGLLGDHFAFACHLCSPRGVSTAFLHRSAQQAYDQAGFRPLIHYPDGTLYWALAEGSPGLPPRSAISEQLEAELASSFPKNSADLVVGSPTATMLPKPDLFEPNQIRTYLHIAASRVGRGAFARKKEDDQLRVARAYTILKG